VAVLGFLTCHSVFVFAVHILIFKFCLPGRVKICREKHKTLSA
jgi:hypothetical protein